MSEQGFDLRTHIMDPKTGAVIKTQPYRMVVTREHGTQFIRDGKVYDAAGVFIRDEEELKKPTAPTTHDQGGKFGAKRTS